MSKSMRHVPTFAALMLLAASCGEAPKSITDPTDVAIVLDKQHSLTDIDPITGSPYSIYGDSAGYGGSQIRSSSVLGAENFEIIQGKASLHVATTLTFEDLPDKTVQHSMSGHNPYLNVTFSTDLYHWNQPGYGQARSGSVFLFNAFGRANQAITYPSPTVFRGVWASEPHGNGSVLIMNAYDINNVLVWTRTSPTLIATTQYVASNNMTPISKVVFNTQYNGGDWYVIDDLNSDGGPLPPPPGTDNTPPVITPNIVGPLGQNGWYIGDVNLTWSVVDNESPITSAPCPPVMVGYNTAGITFTCTATSAGGTSSRSVTIKRDNTPPVITETITGTLGDNGWYVSTVNVTFSITDDVSHAASPNCPNPSIDFDTPGTDRFCTSTNLAGLTTNKTVTIKRDTQKPTILVSNTGTMGMDQWFITDVGVNWIFFDALVGSGLSGVASAIGCDPYNQTTDTPNVSLTCTVKDGAGNSNFRPFVLKRDASVPTIARSVTGTIGNDDWFTSNMTLTWTVTPNGPSGMLASALPCAPVSVTTNTPGISFTCQAVSGAGRFITETANIKRDASVPTVVGTPSGTLGLDSWYTSNVNISWAVFSNGPSGSFAPGCGVSSLGSDTPGETFECTATTGAGLPATGSVSVKRDASLPVITPNLTGTPGTNGWFTSNVGISWSAIAGGPSGATASCPVSTLSSNSTGTDYDCSATSGAGRTATKTVRVKRDASAPEIEATIVGTLGNNGWYRSNVDVSWTTTDATSGIDGSTGCSASTLGTDDASESYTCSATNGAGLPASKTVEVKRDATGPSVSYAGNAGTYTVDQNVSISCTASDAMSGLASNTCENVNGAASTFGAGSHTYEASATDNAGNSGSASTTFTVRATVASLCALTRQFATGPGEIGVENSLCVKLENGSYEAYINEVQAQSGKRISPADALTLIRWARTL